MQANKETITARMHVCDGLPKCLRALVGSAGSRNMSIVIDREGGVFLASSGSSHVPRGRHSHGSTGKNAMLNLMA